MHSHTASPSSVTRQTPWKSHFTDWQGSSELGVSARKNANKSMNQLLHQSVNQSINQASKQASKQSVSLTKMSVLQSVCSSVKWWSFRLKSNGNSNLCTLSRSRQCCQNDYRFLDILHKWILRTVWMWCCKSNWACKLHTVHHQEGGRMLFSQKIQSITAFKAE